MSSRRLPGKVMLDLNGKPVLRWVVDRCRASRLASGVIVLTSTEREDDAIALYCSEANIPCFRGALDDVVARFFEATMEQDEDSFIRITADCPLIDPIVIDAVILNGVANKLDYTGIVGDFPDGLDCTFFSKKAITETNLRANKAYQREHIGQYIEENRRQFRCGGIEIFSGLADVRITLDEEQDFKLLKLLTAELQPDDFSTVDILAILEKQPALREINANIVRNEGLLITKVEKRD